MSTLPISTSTLPSGRIFTTTWLGSPPPLIPVEYQTAEIPLPRLIAMCASAYFFAEDIASRSASSETPARLAAACITSIRPQLC